MVHKQLRKESETLDTEVELLFLEVRIELFEGTYFLLYVLRAGINIAGKSTHQGLLKRAQSN